VVVTGRNLVLLL